jgi:branched-chain amino acid transport system ATP-binding protein
LDAVSLNVEAGHNLGITGENGAGKTTLLRVVAGLHRRSTGRVSYGSISLLGLTPDQIARLGISFVRDGARVFETLTIGEHLELGRRLGNARDQHPPPVEEIVEDFPILARRGLDTKAGYLSGGQRQALCLAMAIATRASCLVLDEPSAGLAESTAAEIFAVIGHLADEGLTLLIAEQDRRWLEGLVDDVTHIEMGRTISET